MRYPVIMATARLNRRHTLALPLASGLLLRPADSGAAAPPALTAAVHALNRLGYGPRPGDLAAVARDVPAWVEQQLNPDTLALPEVLNAPLQAERELAQRDLLATVAELQRLLDERREVAASAAGDAPNPVAAFVRSVQLPAWASRLQRALHSPQQLREVMVDFWFNHFNVFQGKNLARVMVGHYELNAIRPHALGRFVDLLKATAHHPAMLYYLDNWQSVAEGRPGQRGLNENYARELMELHTLGVDAGYQQQDVTQLARMLTGWSFAQPRRGEAASGPHGFLFRERAHDRGEKTWLGQRIAAAGKAEGDAALEHLAAHPATARHLAFKLAQHFVADAPPPELVAALAAAYTRHEGHITPVLRTLFQHPAFWAEAAVGAKFKTPLHYSLSVLRAGGWQLPGEAGVAVLAQQLAAQGMPLHGCPTPDGYKNLEAAWLNPDAMAKRINYAAQVAAGRMGGARLGGGLNGGLALKELLAELGPLAGPATRERALAEASPTLGATLVLAGPGMMRR